MLKQRVLTALVLLALLLPALFTSLAWPFLAFVAVAMTAAGWEWGRLNGLGHASAALLGLLVLGGVLALHFWLPAPPLGFWLLLLGAWVLGGALLLRGGPTGWASRSAITRSVSSWCPYPRWVARTSMFSVRGAGSATQHSHATMPSLRL